jgi:sarcosine oxidase subunit gamma
MADRRSPLDTYADRFAGAGGRTGAVALAELPFRTQLTIRVQPGTVTADALEGALGVALPVDPGSTRGADNLDVLWMGPDEWLVVAEEGALPPAARLEAAAGPDATVVDVSGQRAIVALGGDAARELLAKGCALDLHPRTFAPGACASTLIARTQATLLAREEEYWILVRASFAAYLAEWLLDAAHEYAAAAEPDLVAA